MSLVRKLEGTPPSTPMPAGAVDTQCHIYMPEYPSAPDGPGGPLGTLPTPDQYRQVMKWLGLDRVVITQSNAHQFDNANLLGCLAEFGDIARGVAVIDGSTPDAEITRLADSGCVGARIMDLPGGAVGLDKLLEVDRRTRAFGWCMAVQFDGSHLVELEQNLSEIKSKWILDHHGKIFSGATPEGPQVDVIRRLIDRGNCWIKFSGCYESSLLGPPNYEDIAAVARSLALHAPERIIWGTNWPHNWARSTEEYPDDSRLLDTTLSWFPSSDARRRALVENPEGLFQFV